MSKNATEAQHGKAAGLDTFEPAEILALLASGQQEAASAVNAAVAAIATAAEKAADALRSDAKLVYAGAGSSGLMAMADALELPGTYGIPREKILLLLAGGISSLTDMEGAPEDDTLLAEADAAPIAAGDCVICVSASGSTPYVLKIADIARSRGARVIAIANNAGAKLFDGADVAILLETPPEIVAGSTRMGAGTAQKITFNMLSTLAAIKLGHVHDGHMVNLRPDNEKLRIRAAGMVSEIAGIGFDEARRLMAVAGNSVKVAVLLAAGAADIDAAEALLIRSRQVLRKALAELKTTESSIKRAARR
ncbi:N-acetylmuramic acid 6-phosphate etherase [Neorhizobium alkalisoli]|uniref:N-acetylmuramic acid 6-phosphate etherase n=1 Tax=Neorhizobium alkalisoli TaxID=528178 RepID=A0A561QQW7_9HYPH|nr:N-acetylmuramic acid 6-phosphate etherase [Neorhizobium alkalisoli]TWF52808.1 N-acetylmuramic acid 6-phosphate etherase [Neorhizobium alkalisoli]